MITQDLQKLVIWNKIRYDPELKRALRIPLREALLKDIEQRMATGKNIIISWYGEPGSGKSYGAWEMSERIMDLTGAEFNADHVAFSTQELLDFLKDAEPRTTWILDEQTQVFGTGSKRLMAELDNIEATCRKFQLNFMFCSPMPFVHYDHYVMESFLQRHREERRTYFIVRKPAGSYLSKLGRPMGWIYTEYPKLKSELRRYEKRKSEFIKEILKGSQVDQTEVWKRIARQFLESEWATRKLTKSEMKTILKTEFARGLTGTEINEIVNLIRLAQNDEAFSRVIE